MKSRTMVLLSFLLLLVTPFVSAPANQTPSMSSILKSAKFMKAKALRFRRAADAMELKATRILNKENISSNDLVRIRLLRAQAYTNRQAAFMLESTAWKHVLDVYLKIKKKKL